MERKKNCVTKCYTKWEAFLENIFEKLGSMILRRPKIIMTTCIIANITLALGLLNIQVNNDVEDLYTPMGSKALKDRIAVQRLFGTPTNGFFQTYHLPDFGRYGVITIISKNKSNIMEQGYMNEINALDNIIRTLVAVRDSDGVQYHYDDLCARFSTSCVVSGNIILNGIFQQKFVNDNISYPFYNGKILSPVLANAIHENGKLKSTIGVKLTYHLQQGNASVSALSKLWEKSFVSKLQTIRTNLTDIAYSHSESLGTELNKNTQNDIKFFSVTFTIMMTYASIASLTINCNNVANRMNLGFAGVIAPVLAIASSFGFASLVGIEFTNIVGVMPFLVVGIGIDDMFILMSGMADAPPLSKSSIMERVVFMMQKSGIAITITSLTDLLAFVIGATSVFKSIRNFCIYTGVAVFFCYLNQLFFLCPAIRLNEGRTKEKRHFCLCWKEVQPDNHYIGHSKCFIRCTAGHPPETREDVESPMEKYPKKIMRFILSSLCGKVLITISFMAYLAAAIYGCIHLEQGLQLYNLAAKDSYFYTYSVWDNEFYTKEPVVMLCLTNEQTYSLNETQTAVRRLLNDIKNDETIDKYFEINWLDEYRKTTLFDDTSEINFIQGLKRFLSMNMQFKNDIVFDDTNAKITSSRFYVKSTDIRTSTEQGNFMLRMREIARGSRIPCLIYTAAFVFFEQYVQIISSTLQTIGIAVAVMLFVTFAFMPDVSVVLVVCVTLVCILVGIFGFMHFWDLTLSSITMIHLVMSVGFSVDFSVHVCHAFISVEGNKRKEVLIKALDRSGGPIVNAAFSTLLGILMLGFSSSYIFISFGKVMLLVIAFGLIHAAFFLPLLLYCLLPCLRKHAMTKVSSISPCMITEINAENFPPITDSTEKADSFTDLGKPKY